MTCVETGLRQILTSRAATVRNAARAAKLDRSTSGNGENLELKKNGLCAWQKPFGVYA